MELRWPQNSQHAENLIDQHEKVLRAAKNESIVVYQG